MTEKPNGNMNENHRGERELFSNLGCVGFNTLPTMSLGVSFTRILMGKLKHYVSKLITVSDVQEKRFLLGSHLTEKEREKKTFKRS